MVNRGSHGAIVLEQWREKGGKETRRERVKTYTLLDFGLPHVLEAALSP